MFWFNCAIAIAILSIILIILFLRIAKHNKTIKLYKNFTFKYKIEVKGKQGSASTSEFEAIVKAESFDQAEVQLIERLKSEYKMNIVITHPIKEKERI
jgi:hypothetical protein